MITLKGVNVNTLSTNIEYEQSLFPGGEVFIKIKDVELVKDIDRISAHGPITSSNDLIQLFMLMDAVKEINPNISNNTFNMDYLPYARQDRVCDKGEAFSVREFSRLFARMAIGVFSKVVVRDVHSSMALETFRAALHVADITLFHIDQVTSFRAWNRWIDSQEPTQKMNFSNYVLVAPDKGAVEKTKALAKELGIQTVVEALKTRVGRDITVSISGFQAAKLDGKDVLVVDDICDGGGTFIALADSMNHVGRNIKSMSLWVTHGIFSKGRKPLLKHYNNVWAYTDWTRRKEIK